MGVLQRAQENGAVEKTYEDVDTEPKQRIYLRPATTPVVKEKRKLNKHGYWEVDGQLEHRVVWEQAFGQIPHAWVVHHINFIKQDNRLDNLVALPDKVHTQIHNAMNGGRARYTQAELWPMYTDLKAEYVRLEGLLKTVRQSYKKLCKEYKDLNLNVPGILTPSAGQQKKELRERGKKWAKNKRNRQKYANKK